MIVQTTKGKLEGIIDQGVSVFRGIPYAAPPVDGLRWRRPADAAPWTGVRKAAEFGPSCIQPVFPSMDGTEPVKMMSEDCLYLNVWTAPPAIGAQVLRPVMVWIHGGGFRIGEGRSLMYDGAPLAKKGAVVVTLNYRLGHLGFFAHPAIDREFPDSPVNFGLLDQIKALEWVRDNISGFGGDPGNVTIFGQSAGAASVLSLFCAPEAEGLFHKGIAQSSYAIPEYSRAQALELGAGVANRAWKVAPDASLKELLEVPASVFKDILLPIGKTKEAQLPVPSMSPVAVCGDTVLPDKVRGRFNAGKQHPVPLILGSNSDEQSVLLAFGMKAEDILDTLEDKLGKPTIEQWKGWYREDPEIEPAELDNRGRFGGLILRDILFTMQARWIATRHAPKSTAYRYYFSYVPGKARIKQQGVPHGGEIVFPFNTGDIAPSTEGTFTPFDREMADKVSTYWFNFAKNGVPSDGEPEGSADAKPWPKHTVASDMILKLGHEIESQSLFRKTRLDTFALIYPELEKVIEGLRG